MTKVRCKRQRNFQTSRFWGGWSYINPSTSPGNNLEIPVIVRAWVRDPNQSFEHKKPKFGPSAQVGDGETELLL